MSVEKKWEVVITPKATSVYYNFKELWAYRDLLYMLVKRDFISFYKQTILGPIWFFLQPIFTTVVFIFIFGKLAEISTNDIPQPLFYLIGITLWNYFSESVLNTSSVMSKNAQLFSKVYFPRLILPISVVLSGLLKFGVQLLLFVALYSYYFFAKGYFDLNLIALCFPISVLMLAMIGMGVGTIVASLASKYRDLIFLVSFGVQLLMYGTTVAYPLSSVPEKFQFIVSLNPLTGIIETTRYGFFSKGEFSWILYGYSFLFAIVVLVLGIYLFGRREKNIVDTL